MARNNSNLLLILGIILLVAPFGYSYFKGDGLGGVWQSVYSIKCDIRVSNPIVGTADIDSATCTKSKKLFCGSPLSIFSSDYNIKLTAGTSSKVEYFTLVGVPSLGAKSVSIDVCTKEDVNSVKLELFNKENLKDTQNVQV